MDDVDAGPLPPPTARCGGGHGARHSRGSWRRGGAQARLGQLESLLRPAAGLLRRPAGLRLRGQPPAPPERDGWSEAVRIRRRKEGRRKEKERKMKRKKGKKYKGILDISHLLYTRRGRFAKRFRAK